jgi:hypothetical protein
MKEEGKSKIILKSFAGYSVHLWNRAPDAIKHKKCLWSKNKDETML